LAFGVRGKIGALMICLTLNGQLRDFAPGTTVAGMLAALDYSGKRVAVERNGEIVPRSRHDVTLLDAGDHVEIVVAVGGG
jgi:sulfur carrier protein